MRGSFRNAGLLVLLSCLWSVPPSLAAGPDTDPWYKDADVAWQQTKATKRPLLLLARTERCLYCDQMMRDTLTNRDIQAELQRTFVLATAMDSDKPALIRKLKIATFPTTVIISPEGRVLDKIEGYVPPDKFRARLVSVTRLSSLPGTPSR